MRKTIDLKKNDNWKSYSREKERKRENISTIATKSWKIIKLKKDILSDHRIEPRHIRT